MGEAYPALFAARWGVDPVLSVWIYALNDSTLMCSYVSMVHSYTTLCCCAGSCLSSMDRALRVVSHLSIVESLTDLETCLPSPKLIQRTE